MRGEPDRLLSILFLFLGLLTNAQQIQVKGGFLEDSLVIGEEINFWISAVYPPEMEMVFPDSNYTFTPFEYADKLYFPTELRGDLAFDSTIYTLQSFEIDPIQYLQLSALILSSEDSTILNTPLDSIYLTELAPRVSDTTKLKTNLEYQTVARQFNYPLMYYITGGLVLLTIILLLVFGKRILKYLKIKKLERDYRTFSEAFTQYIHHLKDTPEPDTAEKALSVWKKYHQRLDKFAFSSFTTKEILALDFTQELKDPLKSIDRVVYGKRTQENIYQDFQQIEDFTDERFQKKVAEIKYGK